MVAWNASPVITLVAEPCERHQQLSCLAGSASFLVEDFRTRKHNIYVTKAIRDLTKRRNLLSELSLSINLS